MLIKRNKTKRLNIRMTPEDHKWLFDFASKQKKTVSELFADYLTFLKEGAQEQDADREADIRQS